MRTARALARLFVVLFTWGAAAGAAEIPESLDSVVNPRFRAALETFMPDYDSRGREDRIRAYMRAYRSLNYGEDPVLYPYDAAYVGRWPQPTAALPGSVPPIPLDLSEWDHRYGDDARRAPGYLPPTPTNPPEPRNEERVAQPYDAPFVAHPRHVTRPRIDQRHVEEAHIDQVHVSQRHVQEVHAGP